MDRPSSPESRKETDFQRAGDSAGGCGDVSLADGHRLAWYLTGVFQHVGDRYTQTGDQDPTFGTVDLTSFTGDIGGPYTQNVIAFDPKLPAYSLLNLRIGFLRGMWDTALYINNVTDEEAFLALDIERGSRARVSYMTNQPRTIGISTRLNF